jgi:Glycosyl transferase family 2
MDVVAIVPARDRADSVGATVAALVALPEVTRVLVVDDGSSDPTADRARGAGAEVLRLPGNRGKGGAVAAGVGAAPEAGVYLLVDADVGATAAAAGALLAPVLTGEADMTIGALPGAAGRGGFGAVRRLAGAGIRRATAGFDPATPLSGQRAVRGDLLRSLPLADRFGLETGLTIDAVRAGARVVEVPVAMEHHHTGRRLAGFRHRAGQGADVVRALWPRLTTTRQRIVAILAIGAVLLGLAAWSGQRWTPSTVPLAGRPSKVVLFGMPHIGFADLESGDTPNLDRLIRRGALAAMSVRTMSGKPSSTEGYATLGAGTRVRATDDGAQAYAVADPLEGGTAGQAAYRRTLKRPAGDVVVVGYAATVRLLTGKHLSSEPGALGDAVHAASRRTAVVGNADNPGSRDPKVAPVRRPLAIALADRAGSVDAGTVDPSLLRPDPTAPYSVRFDAAAMVRATRQALARADVVAVDGGDLDRAFACRTAALDRAARADRTLALRRTDALLGAVERALPRDALLLVVSVSPPSGGWRLTPVVAAGPGVPHGWVDSPSVKRRGVVTVTDVGPTVLSALGAAVPDGMIGHAFRYHPGQPSIDKLRRLDRDANFRETIYFPLTVVYIVLQALLYLFAMLVLSRRRAGAGGIAPFLRWAVVAIAAFPLATFVFRAIPNVAVLGDAAIAVLVAVDLVLTAAAMRARRHPLSPLSWIVWGTAGLILVDVATGARLQYSSLLGYSLHTAARFFGIGNTAFAALAASAVIAAAIHVEHGPRRREALLTVAVLLGLCVVVDGAPSLGDDVGGIATLVPVFGLLAVVLWGRRISWRTVGAVLAAMVVLLGVATGIDLLRPPEARTHLGRFVTDLANGNGNSATTIARKAATNVRVFGASVWTWMVPIIAVFMLYLLVYEERGAELLPRGSPRRAGVIGALAAGLLGFAVNDSGVIVTAVVFVYLGPYLTLLALDADRGQPVLLPPTTAGNRPSRGSFAAVVGDGP